MKVLIRFGFGSIPISNFYAVFPKGGLHDFEGSILLLVLPNAAQQDCDCVWSTAPNNAIRSRKSYGSNRRRLHATLSGLFSLNNESFGSVVVSLASCLMNDLQYYGLRPTYRYPLLLRLLLLLSLYPCLIKSIIRQSLVYCQCLKNCRVA